jgi:hypothetical protein
VKNRFQSLPFKCNLQRCTEARSESEQQLAAADQSAATADRPTAAEKRVLLAVHTAGGAVAR